MTSTTHRSQRSVPAFDCLLLATVDKTLIRPFISLLLRFKGIEIVCKLHRERHQQDLANKASEIGYELAAVATELPYVRRSAAGYFPTEQLESEKLSQTTCNDACMTCSGSQSGHTDAAMMETNSI